MNRATSSSECPTSEVLALLLSSNDGGVVAVESWETHIEQCDACQRRLGDLCDSDQVVSWRERLVEEPLHPETACNSLEDTSVNSIAADDPPPALPELPGFEILEEIGRGGMGVVYRARDLALNRVVAIKMLLAGAIAGPERLTRFKVEAEAAATLQHPNVVQIYSIGEHGGLPYLVLEFVDGPNLRDAVVKSLPDYCDAAEFVRKAAHGVHASHEQGVIHRDLKPENLLVAGASASSLAENSEPKLTDFGLAWHVEADVATRSSAVMGTPCYMSPEQARGGRGVTEPAVDVYGLGAVLYFTLTGQPPVDGESAGQVLLDILSRPVDPVSAHRRQVPRDLEIITMKCLEKLPSDRYDSAEALSLDLQRFLNHEPIKARPINTIGRSVRWARRKPLQAILTVSAVVFAIAMLVFGSMYVQQSELAQQAISDRDQIEQKAGVLQVEADAGTYAAQIHEVVRAWRANKFSRMRAALNECLPSHRGWEWGFLKNRVESLHRELPLHDGRVNDIAASVDGQVAASCSEDGSIVVFRVADGHVLAELRSSIGPLKFVRLDTEAGVLAVASLDAVKVFRLDAPGEPTRGFSSWEGDVTGIALRPIESDQVVVCTEKQVVVCDLSKDVAETLRPKRAEEFIGVTFAESGKFIRCATKGGRYVQFDATTLKEVGRFGASPTGHDRAAFTRDGTRAITSQYGGTILKLVDLEFGSSERWRHIGEHRRIEAINDVALHHDRELIATSGATGVTLLTPLELRNGHQMFRAEGEFLEFDTKPVVVEFAQNPDVLLVGDDAGTIHVLQTAILRHLDFLQQSTKRASRSGKLRGRLTLDREGKWLAVAESMAFSSKRPGPHEVELWDADSLQLVGRLPGQAAPIGYLGFGPRDGLLYAVHYDGWVRVYDVGSRTLMRLWQTPHLPLRAALSPDGQYLAIGGRGTECAVTLFNAADGELIHRFPNHPAKAMYTNGIHHLQFSTDGKTLVASSSTTVSVYDLLTKDTRFEVDSSGGMLQPQTGQLLVLDNARLTTYDLNTGQHVQTLDVEGDKRRCFTPDGRLLMLLIREDKPASGISRVERDIALQECLLRIFDPKNGRAVFEWPCARFLLLPDRPAFSPDGLRMFVCDENETLHRFDAAEFRR